MGCTVRLATPADDAAIAELLVEIYVGEGYVPGSARDRLRAPAPEHCVRFVALDSETSLIGVIAAVTSRSAWSQVAQPDELELRRLAVSPSARGSGAAAALMAACQQHGLEIGAKRVVLSTQPTMVAAQRLYDRLGYVRCPARDWHHANGAMLVYELNLPGGPHAADDR